MLQLRKLKEEHYISYIESLHNLAANNSSRDAILKYTYHRDKLLIVGSEEVVKSILQYENEAVGKETDLPGTISSCTGVPDNRPWHNS